MQAFAVPLETPDAHLISLAVYVRPTTIEDVGVLGEEYARVVERARLSSDYEPADVTDSGTISLPVGDAFQIDATMRYVGSASPSPSRPTWDDRLLAYVLVLDGRSLHVVLRGKSDIFPGYRDSIACMMESLRLERRPPEGTAVP